MSCPIIRNTVFDATSNLLPSSVASNSLTKKLCIVEQVPQPLIPPSTANPVIISSSTSTPVGLTNFTNPTAALNSIITITGSGLSGTTLVLINENLQSFNLDTSSSDKNSSGVLEGSIPTGQYTVFLLKGATRYGGYRLQVV